MRFTDQLWSEISVIFNAILDHPFVQELQAGTLPAVRFHYYIRQDALYLTDFGRALAQLAAKSERPADILTFTDFARNALLVEQALHGTYFSRFGIEPATTKMPACFAYTHFLLATTALQSTAVGAAAVLPCFWIYREVGKAIYAGTVGQNPYQAWLDTYAGAEFDLAVNQMLGLTDRLADEAGPAESLKMIEAFVHSSRLEWHFWNDAYEQQSWGI